MVREFLLLTLLMAWGFDARAIHHPEGQEEDDEELIREPVRYKLKFAEWGPRSSQGGTWATFDIFQSGSFLERVTLPARSAQHVRFEADLSDQINRDPLAPLPSSLGQVLERVGYTFSYHHHKKTVERLLPTPRPLLAQWTSQEVLDVNETHYTLAFATLGERGESVPVHPERPFEGHPERHVLLTQDAPFLSQYVFQGGEVGSLYTLTSLRKNPQTGKTYESKERYHKNGVPSHKDNRTIYAEPFALGEQNLQNANSYQGTYVYKRPAHKSEGFPEREERRLLYSNGKRLYHPYVTQEIWQRIDGLVGFFIASYNKHEPLYCFPAVVARNPALQECALPKGLYHLVGIREGERRVEQWVRLGREPHRVDIDISSKPSSIPGRHVVMPLFLENSRETVLHKVLETASYSSPNGAARLLVSEMQPSELSSALNHYLKKYIATEGIKEIIAFCRHKLETHQGDVHVLRESFRRLGQRLQDLRAIFLTTRVGSALEGLIDVTILKRALELLHHLEPHTAIQVDYRIKDWLSPLVDLSSQILALGSAPEIERSASDVQVSALLLGASDIQAVLDASPGRSVRAYGWNHIFLEHDIHAPGRSLSMMAPTFHVEGKRTINLRGNAGAPGGTSYGGRNGAPGTPGQNGGNFCARTAHSQGTGTLHVDVSGGDGGRGGDGRDGCDGADGKDGDLSHCTEVQIADHKYDNPHFDYHEIWNQFVQSYQATGTSGQPGGDGGRAGRGGYGGVPGEIVVGGIKTTFTAETGHDGPDGNQGAGGKGGVHGRDCGGDMIRQVLVSQKAKRGVKQYAIDKTSMIVKTLPHHLPSRGRAPSGCRGIGVNSVGRRTPAASVPLEDEVLIQQYTRAYQDAAQNPMMSLFVEAFPGLKLE